MANLSTTASYDGVYQIETSDPVLGGSPVVGSPTKQGVINWAAQALGNRTEWLKQRADQVARAITDAGITYDGSVVTQLTTAINALIATATASIANGTSLGKDAIKGQAPVWASGTSINFPSITECWDSARSTYLSVPAGTLSFASVGLNGLDASSIAANTWYYIYAVKSGSSTGFVASTNATAPAGYSVYRKLPLAVKTKINTPALMLFSISNWGSFPYVKWIDAWESDWAAGVPSVPQSTMDSTYVLNRGLATIMTAVSCSQFVPSFSTRASAMIAIDASGGTGNTFAMWRHPGASANTMGSRYWRSPSVEIGIYHDFLDLYTTQQFQYQVNGACGMYVCITGYQVTEVVG